jgi:anti-sigma B factor antagonist
MELDEQADGRIVTVGLHGRVDDDSGAAAALRARVRELVAQGYTFILLNVADLIYVDSMLLGAIVQAYASAIQVGGTLKLIHVTKRLRELLAATKLDRVIKTVDEDPPRESP